MKAPGVGDGPPIKIAETMTAKTPVAPKPVAADAAQPKVAESPLPKINTEADALAIAQARAQLKKEAGGLSDADEQKFIEDETQRILEKAITPELEKEKPQGVKEAGAADAPQTGTPAAPSQTKKEEGKQEEATPEQSELTADQDWAEIEDAFARNHDPLEGSTVYQARRALEEGFWDDDPAKIDAYLMAHGVTTITPELRQIEIARREKIRAAIKQVKDALDAEDAAESEIEATIFKDKITAPDETGRVAQRVQIEKNSAAEIQAIRDKHYTVDKDGNYILDPNGKRIPVSIKAHTKTLVEEALPDLSEDASNPKRQARAKKNYDKLKNRIKEDGGFKAERSKTAQEVEAEKNNEVDQKMEDIFIEAYQDAIGHPKKNGKEVDVVVFRRNPDGSVYTDPATGHRVIEEFHPELLEGTADAFLSGTTHLFAAYLDKDHPPTDEQRHNIMAMIYKHVQVANPDRLRGFSGSQIMEDRLNTKIGHDFSKWLVTNGFRTPIDLSSATMGDLVNILSFASACHRGKLIEHTARGEARFSERAATAFRDIFKDNINPDYEKYIITLADDDQDWGSFFLSQQFNLNTETLTTQTGRTANVKSVIGEIAKRRGLSPDEQEKYSQVALDMANDKKLEEMAKKLGLPPGMGMGVIMLALFLPMIQGVMDTGNERGGGGGEGG